MANTSYWASNVETATRDRIRSSQDGKVASQTRWVYRNSPFWRSRFEERDCHPESIDSVDELSLAPFGRKRDYREAQRNDPPYGGLLCRSAEEIHRDGGFVWETSGTSGEPLKFLCSQAEFERVDVEATCRILWTAGVRPGDTVAMFWPLTLWAVGHGIVRATARIGATTLPLGPSYSTEYRVRKIEQYRPDVIMSTPTYALRLATVADDHGIDPGDIGVDRAIVSGEPLPGETRKEIGQRWRLSGSVYDYYGLSEAFNCRSIECEYHRGMHVLEDLYLCQVVDPEGRQPVGPDETGELVVTALEQRDIASGFHYRTGDIARFTDEPCECGRTTRRIEIISRKDDMRTIKGVNVFPQAVESVVRSVDGVADEFRLVHERNGDLDGVRVITEPRTNDVDRDTVRIELERSLESAFGGLGVPVSFVDPGDLERSDMKSDRWVEDV